VCRGSKRKVYSIPNRPPWAESYLSLRAALINTTSAVNDYRNGWSTRPEYAARAAELLHIDQSPLFRTLTLPSVAECLQHDLECG